jgi:hypothetical protein
MEKSEHHIEFIGKFEYYLINGELYRASIDRPVMTEGYRYGRWEAPAHMVNQYMKMYRESYQKFDTQTN